MKRQLTLGILAHVDAGKTTLSEAMLYLTGAIRKAGRVDNRDAFLDHNSMERARGITIFSKQAILQLGEMEITLLDTPGHVDFGTEMERALQVLDMAVLLISAADGITSHTRTLLQLLETYHVPTFVFVNKMDQPGADREQLMRELTEKVSDGCVDFCGFREAGKAVNTAWSEEDDTANMTLPDTTQAAHASWLETVAMCDEALMNAYLETGTISEEQIQEKIARRKLFPCFFGSALRMQGVKELLRGIAQFGVSPQYEQTFGARVFKITRDAQGNRLTHMKLTGGFLRARDAILDEKINQIRRYSGEKFETVTEAHAGMVCAVTGLGNTYPGQGLGFEEDMPHVQLQPVLCYCLQLPDGENPAAVMPKLRQLQEEDPTLSITWEEALSEIHVHVMGDVQMEILKELIRERFGLAVAFSKGQILYRETIADTVEGVGHFEPLRHYAEVHLKLEPGEPGSGLVFDTICREEALAVNWQRLILTHLSEKQHRGVLTGAPITDMKITLIGGRAHQKHTEGGDFRKATYRAVRQGLMQAASVLLEPYYAFRLEVPEEMTGRAMTDMDRLHAQFTLAQQGGGHSVLTGSAPVYTMQDYAKEVGAYTGGRGHLDVRLAGYGPCHNADEVIAGKQYDPQADLRNTPDSVFCAHGAGFVVPWDQVKEYMHVESCLYEDQTQQEERAFQEELKKRRDAARRREETAGERGEYFLGIEEIDALVDAAGGIRTDARKKEGWQREKRDASAAEGTRTRIYKGQPKKEAYLLVDGYNVIFAWEELSELAKVTLDGARGRLLDILCDYQAMKACKLIVVFDAYRLKGHPEEAFAYHNIQVVYTKEAETADRFIERFSHDNSKNYDITVATSDGMEQIIIRGEGCRLLSSRDLLTEVRLHQENMREMLAETGRPSGPSGAGFGSKLPIPEDYQRSQNR